MTISTLAQYQAALKQPIIFQWASGGALNTTSLPQSTWDWTGGVPSGGSLAIGNTANGIVPTNATAGAATIPTFSGTGYLTRMEFQSLATSVTGTSPYVILYDRLFHAGSYAFNAAVTLTAQPSYSSRVPGGTDFKGLQIWFETATAFTGNPSVAVTYTNDAGVAGHTTGTVALGAVGLRAMVQLPLQAGDQGVQKIESVTATVATAGTFNIVVARRLRAVRGRVSHGLSRALWLDRTSMQQIYPTSCLALMVPSSGVPTSSMRVDCELASA